MTIADRLIAHRGWRNRYPENTLLAVEAAIQAGAKHVEIDIQLTADHIPMLFHDQSMQRLCQHDQDITTLKASELAGLSAYEPQRLGDTFLGTPLCTLQKCAELVQQHPDTTLYVEIKEESLQRFGNDAVLHAVLPILQPIRQHCCLISFDIEVLSAAQRAGWQRVVPVLTSLQQLQGLDDLTPSLVFCDTTLLSDVVSCADLPYSMALYEISTYQEAEQWLSRGASLIETFCVGELINEDRKRINAT